MTVVRRRRRAVNEIHALQRRAQRITDGPEIAQMPLTDAKVAILFPKIS